MENYSNNSSAKKVIILLVVVIIIALITGAAAYFLKNRAVGVLEKTETLPSGDIMTRAAERKTVRSFPKELILEDDVIVADSYAINYVNDDINMPVASFESKMSYSDAIQKYGEYIKNNGWQIVNEANSNEPITFWYGKKGNEDLNVSIENREGKTYISIAYSVLGER